MKKSVIEGKEHWTGSQGSDLSQSLALSFFIYTPSGLDYGSSFLGTFPAPIFQNLPPEESF